METFHGSGAGVTLTMKDSGTKVIGAIGANPLITPIMVDIMEREKII